MANIAVLGYGTVGSGVVEVLEVNRDTVAEHAKEVVNVKYVLDLRDFPGDKVEKVLVHDFDVILNDDDVEIVAEVLGGVKFAYPYVKSALLKGKSVVTSNKELVAKHGAELLKIAKEKNVNFFFEASVGGGIPVIRPLNDCFTAERICEITGILNGTTNYILTKMAKEGLDFGVVLKDAQDKGYAERNPEADVEGYDAGRKLAILTSLAYGKQVDFEDIYIEGITSVTPDDIRLAASIGGRIKLIASSRYIDGKIYSLVSPAILETSHPLYGVEDVFNAIMVEGNMVGRTMFYGKGAGKLPTASAVVADIIAAVNNRGRNIDIKWSEEKLSLSDIDKSSKRFFVRINDTAESRAEVFKLFGIKDTEFIRAYEASDCCAFITDAMTEKEFHDKEAELTWVRNRIRMQ